jgi:hypothetical protein
MFFRESEGIGLDISAFQKNETKTMLGKLCLNSF